MVQRRPKGSPWPISPEWTAWVRDQMAAAGINQAELTRRINANRFSRGDRPVSHAAVSMALNAVSGHTRLMPDINHVLGGAMPTPPTPEHRAADDIRARIIAGLADLDEHQCKLVADVIAGLVRK